jgi:amidase
VPASYCGLWGLRTTQGLVSTRGLVPLAPGFDTATWLAHDAVTFARVGEVLLPEARLVPRQLIVLDDARALADPAFTAPLRAVVRELSAAWRLAPRYERASGDSSLEAWRSVYATLAPWQSWRAHGDWIGREQPRFGPAIEARWQGARAISAVRADEASRAAAEISARVRELLGADGIAVLPSAASVAPRRDAEASAVDAVRLRTMAITCIAGLAGLPQVSIPFVAATADAPLPVGVSLLGPPGSDRALIAIATAVREALP